MDTVSLYYSLLHCVNNVGALQSAIWNVAIARFSEKLLNQSLRIANRSTRYGVPFSSHFQALCRRQNYNTIAPGTFEAGAQRKVLNDAKLKDHSFVCMHETLPPGPVKFHANGRKVVWFSWTSFRDSNEFVEMLQSVPAQERSFYEILPTHGPISWLFDLEWTVAGASSDSEQLKEDRAIRLSSLMQLVSKCCKSFGIPPFDSSEVVVKESHRAIEGRFKNSFHLIQW